jgi:hypothetical protein
MPPGRHPETKKIYLPKAESHEVDSAVGPFSRGQQSGDLPLAESHGVDSA